MAEARDPEPIARPTITITFAGVGAADMSIEASDDVGPSQVYGAAFLIDLWAHEVRIAMLAAAARAAQARSVELVVPTAINRQMRRHPES